MCSQLKRCGMVGTDKDFYILILEFVKQLAEYLFVNKAYCLYLIVNLITMTAFIGSFNMDIYKILAALQCVNSRLSLTVKVCIYVACCTVNLDNVHSGELADTSEQIDRRDHSGTLSVLFGKRSKILANTLAPEPYTVCRTKTSFDSL